MTIRPYQAEDLEAVTELIRELGYEREAAILECRIRTLRATGDYEFFVADVGGTAVGLIEVHREESFIDGDRGLIGALVVSSKCRRTGAGRQLVKAAENWTAKRGLIKLRVGTNMVREDAHKFYESLGFTLNKRHHIYLKEIG